MRLPHSLHPPRIEYGEIAHQLKLGSDRPLGKDQIRRLDRTPWPETALEPDRFDLALEPMGHLDEPPMPAADRPFWAQRQLDSLFGEGVLTPYLAPDAVQQDGARILRHLAKRLEGELGEGVGDRLGHLAVLKRLPKGYEFLSQTGATGNILQSAQWVDAAWSVALAAEIAQHPEQVAAALVRVMIESDPLQRPNEAQMRAIRWQARSAWASALAPDLVHAHGQHGALGVAPGMEEAEQIELKAAKAGIELPVRAGYSPLAIGLLPLYRSYKNFLTIAEFSPQDARSSAPSMDLYREVYEQLQALSVDRRTIWTAEGAQTGDPYMNDVQMEELMRLPKPDDAAKAFWPALDLRSEWPGATAVNRIRNHRRQRELRGSMFSTRTPA